MSLLSLPPEIIQLIGEALPTQADILSLMVTHPRIYGLLPLSQLLYDRTPEDRLRQAFRWSCKNGNENLARAMIQREVHLDMEGDSKSWRTVMWEAASGGHTKILDLVMTVIPNATEDIRPYNVAIESAICYGQKESFQTVLSALGPHLNPNHKETMSLGDALNYRQYFAFNTPIHMAFRHGKGEFVKALLDNGTFFLDSQCLREASSGGNIDLVRLCLREAPRPEKRFDDSPLCSAAKRGHLDVFKLLIDNGYPDLSVKDKYRQPLLHLAVQSGSSDLVEFLLTKEGIDVDSKGGSDSTPFLLAARGGHQEIMRLLLNTNMVDAEAADYKRRTPLSHAAEWGKCEAVSLLLSLHGVDPDSRDCDNKTPFMWAAGRGNVGVVEKLLETGRVDPNARANENLDGYTPLLFAAQCRFSSSSSDQTDYREMDKIARRDTLNLLRCKPGLSTIAGTVDGSLRERNPPAAVSELLKYDTVDVNARDELGQTALMLAAQKRYVEMVRVLVVQGRANVKLKDDDGWTAFTHAERGWKPRRRTQDEINEAAWDAWEASL